MVEPHLTLSEIYDRFTPNSNLIVQINRAGVSESHSRLHSPSVIVSIAACVRRI